MTSGISSQLLEKSVILPHTESSNNIVARDDGPRAALRHYRDTVIVDAADADAADELNAVLFQQLQDIPLGAGE